MGSIWGVHMDRTVGTRPVDEGYVAIGWPKLGNLQSIGKTREAFKEAIKQRYPDAKPGSIPVQAGVIYRFLHEVHDGDVVVYPSKNDRLVNIGRFAGEYQYDPEKHPEYPNVRPVEWLKQFPRDQFSQAALYEIGSFITLFSIRNHVEEFLAALEDRTINEAAEEAEEREDDETVARSASVQAQETTTDFVIRQLKTGIDSYQFESFIAHLLARKIHGGLADVA